jgi:hypothetical protein
MFGQFKPVLFEPYGRRRSRWRVPRWLVLLSTGIALGAGGVILVQERYLPPRLSPAASAEIRRSFEEANSARLRLQVELNDQTQRLESALADKKTLTDDLAANRARTQALRDDLNSVIASMPPDPRGGIVDIRAGWFVARGTTLTYDLVLTRDRPSTTPISGSMQFFIAGETAAGTPRNFTSQPIPVTIGSPQILRGSVTLPGDFVAKQTTIQLADRNGGKSLGMRVLLIKTL